LTDIRQQKRHPKRDQNNGDREKDGFLDGQVPDEDSGGLGRIDRPRARADGQRIHRGQIGCSC
jgi:hypothetical protein